MYLHQEKLCWTLGRWGETRREGQEKDQEDSEAQAQRRPE